MLLCLAQTTTRPGALGASCIQPRPAPYVSTQIDLRHKASIAARGASGRNLHQGVLQTMALHAAHDMSYRSSTKKRSPTNDAQAPELTAQQQSWPFLSRGVALSWYLRLRLVNNAPATEKTNCSPRHNYRMHAALRWFKIAKLLTYRINMAQIHALSAEQRLAQWVIYAVLAAPIVATLLRDLGVGAVAPWILYATIAVPMIAMLSHREINVDLIIRWVLFAIIALTPILPTRFY